MAIVSSGPISIDDIRTELGHTGSLSLGTTSARDLVSISSGQISLSDYYGASAAPPWVDQSLRSVFDTTYAWTTYGTNWLIVDAGSQDTVVSNGSVLSNTNPETLLSISGVPDGGYIVVTGVLGYPFAPTTTGGNLGMNILWGPGSTSFAYGVIGANGSTYTGTKTTSSGGSTDYYATASSSNASAYATTSNPSLQIGWRWQHTSARDGTTIIFRFVNQAYISGVGFLQFLAQYKLTIN